MTTVSARKDIIIHIASVMIEELKLEDVTPETFDPDIDLVDEIVGDKGS